MNESSKAVNKRMYALLTVSIMLMVLGLFGCFYTLAGGAGYNPNMLRGSISFKYYPKYLQYTCNKGTVVGSQCKTEKTVTRAGKNSCRSGERTIKVWNDTYGNYYTHCAQPVYKRARPVSCSKGEFVTVNYEKTCMVYNGVGPTPKSSNNKCDYYNFDARTVIYCPDGYDYENGECVSIINNPRGNCPSGYKAVEYSSTSRMPTKCKKTTTIDPHCASSKMQVMAAGDGKLTCRLCMQNTTTKKANNKKTVRKTTTTKKIVTTQKQLNIACYMKVDGKDTDVKKIGKAYTDNYIYCKTNQKGASWSVDGISSKDMKLYNYTVRFKYSDAKDKAVVKVSKNGYRTNQTSFKVADKCDIDVKTSDNTINISATCDSNNALYKTYVLDRNNTIKGYNEYTKDYGKSKTKIIKLSKGRYNLQIQSVNKKGKTKTLKKTVDVPGGYYASTFNLGDDKRCKVSGFEIENKTVRANLACGKNAKITKITLLNLTTDKSKNVNASKYSSYGYNGSISIPVSDEDDYRLRVYYSINDNDNIGVRSFVSTTEQPLIMYCPDNVRVGDKFICYVKSDFDGTNITLTSGNSKKSSNGKRALGTSVKKAGTVNASAVYKSQKFNKKINILNKSDISKQKVDLYCNKHGTKVNQKFYCSSTIDGVKIKISGGGCKLSNSSSNQFTTSFKNGSIKYYNYFTCSSKGNATVTASKSGYKTKTFNITVQ